MTPYIYLGLLQNSRDKFLKSKYTKKNELELKQILKTVEDYFGYSIIEPGLRARKKQKERELFYYFCFELLYDKQPKGERSRFFKQIGEIVHRNRVSIFHNYNLWRDYQFVNDYCHFSGNFFRNHYYILKGMFDGDDYTDCLMKYRP